MPPLESHNEAGEARTWESNPSRRAAVLSSGVELPELRHHGRADSLSNPPSAVHDAFEARETVLLVVGRIDSRRMQIAWKLRENWGRAGEGWEEYNARVSRGLRDDQPPATSVQAPSLKCPPDQRDHEVLLTVSPVLVLVPLLCCPWPTHDAQDTFPSNPQHGCMWTVTQSDSYFSGATRLSKPSRTSIVRGTAAIQRAGNEALRMPATHTQILDRLQEATMFNAGDANDGQSVLGTGIWQAPRGRNLLMPMTNEIGFFPQRDEDPEDSTEALGKRLLSAVLIDPRDSATEVKKRELKKQIVVQMSRKLEEMRSGTRLHPLP
ncbi:hypothetical protein DFH06DRAFT_1124234 [Mycena polygramma]|nr:hypothetical protein DFH06DRAFT_1124234 [Mycena polygramma]